MNDNTKFAIQPADLLERLDDWNKEFESKLVHQLSFLEVLEEFVRVEQRFYFSDEADSSFIREVVDAALQRVISGHLEVYDQYPEERREVMQQLVESLAVGMLNHYEDYLERHWRSKPATLSDGDAYYALVRQRIKEHHDSLVTLLEPTSLEGVTVEILRARIEEYQTAWFEQSPLLVASTQ